jgi:predicted phosphodiesterase
MISYTNFKDWGPYLSFGTDSSKEIRVSWNTEQYFFEISLWIGEDKERMQKITHQYDEPKTHHCFIISDLKPDTHYYYKIESEKKERSNSMHSFRTGPELFSSNSFDFVVLSDMHANGIDRIKFGDVFPATVRNVPNNRFYLALGDSVDDGMRDIDWQYFFETANSYLFSRPIMNTTGNHDTNSLQKYARFISIWDHPYVNKKKAANYVFYYADVAYIMLDSDNGGNLGTVISDEQMTWLEEQLQIAYEKDLWIFVCFHRQMYSTGDFSMEPILHQFYRPIFDEFHVDCVMYGHDHNYQLFWTDRDSEWGGTKYFVCGASGGPVRTEYKILGPNNGETIYIWPGLTYSYERDGILPAGKMGANQKMHRMDDICKSQIYGVLIPNFVHFHIENDQCTVRCIGFEDQLYHTYSFKKTKKKL